MDRLRRIQKSTTERRGDWDRVTDRMRVLDPTALADAIQTVVEEQYGGSLTKAAKKVSLSRTTLRRLAECPLPETPSVREISIDVFGKLQLLFGDPEVDSEFLIPRARESFQRSFLNPRAGESLRRYSNWLLKQSRIPKAEFRYRAAEIVRLLKRIRKDVPAVASRILDWLDSSEIAYHPWIDALGGTHRAGERHPPGGIKSQRCEMMILRILDPLLQQRATGGIERNADELSTKEFRRFVEQGWRRETIMLNRQGDFARAQALSRERHKKDAV